ncbi:6-N-acetylglucosamine synthase (BcsA) [Fructobacillus tropaeoli]|uniref:glycosyltransferase n=1 Tax=Fructobacillus tropaeoli TaxID=709323 RepID=UPI002D9C3310|nr:6-N-acetylglucosamine synthase (BcsA) [Fructobacillus tropaeoli]
MRKASLQGNTKTLSSVRKYQNKRSKPYTYKMILSIWIITMVIFEYFTFRYGVLPTYYAGHPYYSMLIILNQLFVGIFFYFGILHFVFPVVYQREKQDVIAYENNVLSTALQDNFYPKVLLLYTTYNDFLPYAADQCFQQTYTNCQSVILDNSTDNYYINKVRRYVQLHSNVQLIHDVNNRYAKAGNLNHFLCHELHDDYDYFVILDADELLEKEFVEKTLKFFQFAQQHEQRQLGIVQANHISGQNLNEFQSLFSSSGNSFWPVQNTVRSMFSGTLSKDNNGEVIQVSKGDCVDIELGHGTIVSKKCFEAVGQIPQAVAEDLCFSVEALFKGFNIQFVHQIYGNEAFPINQAALMTRSAKFSSANFEFMKLYGKKIWQTKVLSKTQKLDLLSFVLSDILFALEYLSLTLSSIVFPLAHVHTGMQTFFLIPTLIVYFSQSIADGWFQKLSGWTLWKVIKYECLAAFLYGGMYYITVKAAFLSLFGVSAKFRTTPKKHNKITFLDAFKSNFSGIIFSLSTIIIVLFCSGSSWILLSFVPGVIGFLVYSLANKSTYSNRKAHVIIENGNYNALTSLQGEIVPWDI